jgi:hypothetical protein
MGEHGEDGLARNAEGLTPCVGEHLTGREGVPDVAALHDIDRVESTGNRHARAPKL